MEPKWRVNVLTLVGIAIGICSFFIVWIHTTYDQTSDGIIDFDYYYDLLGLLSVSAGVLFIFGTVAAIFTPLAGFIQFFGWVGLMSGVYFTRVDMGIFEDYHEIGYAIGFISIVVVLISMIRPIGIGYSEKKFTLKQRTLTLSRHEESVSQSIYLG